MKKAQKIMALAIALVAVFGGMVIQPAQVRASILNLPNFVFDPFWTLEYATDNTPIASYWWVTLQTTHPDGFRVENQRCTGVTNPNANCAYIKREFLNSYLHTEMQPDQGNPYWLVQFGDVKDSFIWAFSGEFDETGFPIANQVHDMRWFPEPGKKIILQTRARFSPNYKADASGSSHGSTGFGLWNNPAYHIGNQVAAVGAKAIFFTYTENGSIWEGYNGVAVDQDFPEISTPEYLVPMKNFDMSKWSTQTIIWEADHQGNQSVTFSILQGSNHLVHTIDLDRPLPPMALVNWIAADKVVETQGSVTSLTSPIVETQWMDWDYYSVIEI